ncbi:hypothetical protein DMUE_1416 [Dictyocoela muelleri]|nr:hypothetical protein DMUE_1416 [Dictyocoela muelleri]
MKPCKYFLKGECKFGKNCQYEHPIISNLVNPPEWLLTSFEENGISIPLLDFSFEEVRANFYATQNIEQLQIDWNDAIRSNYYVLMDNLKKMMQNGRVISESGRFVDYRSPRSVEAFPDNVKKALIDFWIEDNDKQKNFDKQKIFDKQRNFGKQRNFDKSPYLENYDSQKRNEHFGRQDFNQGGKFNRYQDSGMRPYRGEKSNYTQDPNYVQKNNYYQKQYQNNYQRPYQDNQRPYQDNNQRPYQDNNQRLYQDNNQRPYQNNNQRPYHDNQRPYHDNNQRPYQNNNQRPYHDNNQRPYQNNNQRPYQNNNQRPYHDNNYRPYHDNNQRSYNNRKTFEGDNSINYNNRREIEYLPPKGNETRFNDQRNKNNYEIEGEYDYNNEKRYDHNTRGYTNNNNPENVYNLMNNNNELETPFQNIKPRNKKDKEDPEFEFGGIPFDFDKK